VSRTPSLGFLQVSRCFPAVRLPAKEAIPVSVLVALRKRQLTRQLCRKCNLSEDEVRLSPMTSGLILTRLYAGYQLPSPDAL
jgi:hypothetical protein